MGDKRGAWAKARLLVNQRAKMYVSPIGLGYLKSVQEQEQRSVQQVGYANADKVSVRRGVDPPKFMKMRAGFMEMSYSGQ